LPEVNVASLSFAQAASGVALGAVDADAAVEGAALDALDALADGLAPPLVLQAAAITAISTTTDDLSALRMS
jgi:hypothetical protein